MKKTVVVGLSGGVDSAVSAYLLKEQGYDVVGIFMKNWDDKNDENCPAEKDFEDVQRIAQQLDIPYYTVNLSKEYWVEIFEDFINDHKKGLTPNPDVLCNQFIKFQHFFKKATEDFGADYVATGHYCRVKKDHSFPLMKGLDPNKDQSYFLHSISPEVLPRVLFPLGEIDKTEVRSIAQKIKLIVADKKDSTGICFIGERKFTEFLSQYVHKYQGDIEDEKGQVVGRHKGLAFYTIGQRKGLELGGPGEPWFVSFKDIERNVLKVIRGHDHPALMKTELIAEQFRLLSAGSYSLEDLSKLRITAKIRYRQTDQECQISSWNQKTNEISVRFANEQRAVTPGQYIVFYHEQHCLGGARIIK